MKCTVIFWGVLLAVALGGCSTPQAPIRVLFIGNSHTYVNKVPEQLLALAKAAQPPKPLQVESVAIGGATLERQLTDGRAMGAIARGGWDDVVLQEQSAQAVLEPQRFETSATALVAAIRKVGAKPVLSMGWVRKDLTDYTQNDWTNAVLKVASSSRASVAPVGQAWRLALEKNPGSPLYQADGNHASPQGSYLAACVFFASFFDRTPVGLSGRVEHPNVPKEILADLDTAQAKTLQQAAWDSVNLLESRFRLDPRVASR